MQQKIWDTLDILFLVRVKDLGFDFVVIGFRFILGKPSGKAERVGKVKEKAPLVMSGAVFFYIVSSGAVGCLTPVSG